MPNSKTKNTATPPLPKKPINKGGMVMAVVLFLLALIYTGYLGFLVMEADELKVDMTTWVINIFMTMIFYSMAYRCYKTAKANQKLITDPYLPASEQSSLLAKPLVLFAKLLSTIFFLMVAIMGLIASDLALLGCGVALAFGIHVSYLQQKFPKIDWVKLFFGLIFLVMVVAGVMGKLK